MGDALGTAEYTSWCPISEVGKKGCRWELTPTPERCWWCLCIHLFFSSPTKEFTVLRSRSLWRGCHHLPMQETQGQQVGSLGQEDTWRRKWRPPPVFLPGEPHEQSSLGGHSPGACNKMAQSTSELSENPSSGRSSQEVRQHSQLLGCFLLL